VDENVDIMIMSETIISEATTLGEALSACAARFPQRTALVSAEWRLTYGQLLGIAASQAAVLRAHGAVPGGRVAIYLPRGPNLVIALVAAALTGSTQLAVDPDDPPARVRRLLADAAPSVLVTESSLLAGVAGLAGPAGSFDVVLAGELPDEPFSVPEVPGSPDDPAYMVYTSGSTGEPKASLISHRALLSRLGWLQRRYGLAADDRVLLKTACGFDVFIAELYWPLTAGATLVIAPPGAQRDPDYLARAVLTEGVTTLHFVPTLLEIFLAGRDPQERYDSLRRVLAGGEALTPELVGRFQARSTAELHNMYGPSECAIYSTAWECPRDPDLARVLIGGPVDGAELWVLDEDRQPVPPGTAGELYIGGDGLANGYHFRPELTSERFATLNLAGAARRVYQTGDRVRDAGGGELEFLGRMDTQIKIRGYRVEPGEIEIAILGTGLVRAAVVVAATTGAGQRLVAFVILSEPADAGRASEEILAALRRDLPAYLVPVAIVDVDQLPVTVNGKVDRKELATRAAEVRPAAPAAPAVKPTTLTGAIPALVTTLWKQQLDIDQVDEDDDFFLLGGDSRAAVELVRSLASELSYRIPARALFDSPTLAEFAAYVVQLDNANASERR
jgi:amino acid adenylation domain-containing protein